MTGPFGLIAEYSVLKASFALSTLCAVFLEAFAFSLGKGRDEDDDHTAKYASSRHGTARHLSSRTQSRRDATYCRLHTVKFYNWSNNNSTTRV